MKRRQPDLMSVVLSRCVVRGECYEWTGAQRGKYGVMAIPGANRIDGVHRIVMRELGNNVDGFQVCHHCDNPPCCNPDHLFVGTALDNVKDCIAKGRAVNPPPTNWPERMKKTPHHWQKLSRDQVLEIKLLLAAGIRQAEIAIKFAISPKTISKINVGTRWGHLNATA